MQVMYQRCAGIDVHLRFLVVCLIIVEAGQRRKEIRSFRLALDPVAETTAFNPSSDGAF